MKINPTKSIAIVMLFAIGFSELTIPLAAANQLQNRNLMQPQVAETKSETVLQIIPKMSDTPAVLGLADTTPTQSSARQPLPMTVQELEKETYKAEEDVTVTINNPDEEEFTTKLLDAKGEEVPAAVYQIDKGTVTELQVTASNQFKPGKYTIEIIDGEGNAAKQDFTWGVLALNFDKAVYKPQETAQIAMAVLDEKGEMVCDARVELRVESVELRINDVLSTEDGTIVVNEECRSKDFTLKPDYEAVYKVGKAGEYEVTLTAETAKGTYTITDGFQVAESTPFDIKRTSATRIYPPLLYPMNIEITANQDFTGTITETVPESFTIVPSDQEESYDKMRTLYTQTDNNPEAQLKDAILGASGTALQMPFDGEFAISQGFGTALTDISLREFYSSYGLGGHDGIDFGVPSGTPLYAVDEGAVIWSGEGDYGITIIIEHSWGRSYYGHLSKTEVERGTSVSKGALIGYSGNTGESTGPHLHFGIKPTVPDTMNGYLGKIDPLPFLGIAAPAENLDLSFAGAVLAASTSAEAEGNPKSEITNPKQIQNTNEQNTKTASNAALRFENSDLENSEIVSGFDIRASNLEASASAEPAFILEDEVINEKIVADQPPILEKVKVIKWEVSLKKGEKTTLSYKYRAPQISPQFYLVGGLSFYSSSEASAQSRSSDVLDSTALRSNNMVLVFEEPRKWQIAADAVGTDWYDYSWEYRKQVTIDKDQIGATRDAWCNDNSGVMCSTSWDARRKITFDNSASGTNLTNFPVLVAIDSNDIDRTKTQIDGDDLRFVDPSNNALVLDHEIEEYNESGTDYVWVEVPQINSGSTTDYIWMYYDNAGVGSGENPTGVWDSDYLAVYHLDQNGDHIGNDYLDSTSNAEHAQGGGGTSGRQPAVTTAGQISSAQDFTPENDHIQSPGLTYVNDITISIWFKGGTQTAGDWNYFTTSSNTDSIEFGTFGEDLNFKDDGQGAGAATGDFNDNTWHLATGVINGSNITLYMDGQFEDANAYPGGSNNGNVSFNIGGVGSDRGWDGLLDEMRFSDIARSADWIEAEYLTMTDAMNSFGPEELETVTLNSFPVLINLSSDAQLAANVQSDGDDILFTDSTGRTKIPHEIESYNSGTGALVAWVTPSSVNDQTDTDIYMYYGNPAAANQEDVTAVWDSNFRLVQHLSEGAVITTQDSTSNNNDGTKLATTSPTAFTSGRIGGAQDFDGTGDFINIANSATLENLTEASYTLSAWANIDTVPEVFPRSDAYGIIIKQGFHTGLRYGGAQTFYATQYNHSNNAIQANTGTVYGQGQWYYVTQVFNTGTNLVYLYVNGVLTDTETFFGTLKDYGTEVFKIGRAEESAICSDTFTWCMDGKIDEVRMSNTNRSADWIATEYNNQNSPSTFYTLGSEETKVFAPVNAELMRHGNFFDSSGTEQVFVY